ncbi:MULTISPECIES: peptidase [Halorussus]|uniref:pyroglutamyl-peptidase I family protein n=1 Tax=Halorussus TaxID=1070314 RepID=UPI0020A1832E|nr:peptidase [Halorussus vallis]USZ78182.1 peptidase [Halorussus vallis]
MTLLLTGYEPFGDRERNPTAEVARELDGETVADRDVVGRVLPVEFDRAGGEMRELIEEYDPDAIVATGLAAGRTAVSIERVGVNVADCAGVPDNDGVEPRDERIRPGDGEPAAYFSTLPVVEVVESLLGAGIPARISNTAGTHLCNDLLYRTRAHLERESRDVPMGFVHLPLTPEMAAAEAHEAEATAGGEVQPSLPLETQVAAVVRTFETAVRDK